MKELLKTLKGYMNVVVLGPQRSGTRIGSKVLSHELGYEYVDEKAFGIESEKDFKDILRMPHPKVIQAPAMTHKAGFMASPVTAVVLMVRGMEDISASEKRIDWQYGAHEVRKFPESAQCYVSAAATKYAFWEVTVKMEDIPHCYELCYDDLKGHKLFIEKSKRKHFKWDQTS